VATVSGEWSVPPPPLGRRDRLSREFSSPLPIANQENIVRALALLDFGAAPELTDLAMPEPGNAEVRVRVHAASINGFDAAVASGSLNGTIEHRFPVVLGRDFAGTVDAIGGGVVEYQVGDRVFGVVTKPSLGDGSFAEYVTVPATFGIAVLPEQIDFLEGAALGLAGTTAIAVVEAADLHPGQTVLIAGATGGVGNQVVQLAAKSGAHVVATARTPDGKALVTAFGATTVLDYAGDVAANTTAAHPDGVDVVIHLAGDPSALLAVVRDGGRFVSTLIGPADQISTEHATVIAVFANPDAGVLWRAARHEADGTTRVHIQDTYPLDKAATALATFAAGTVGKIVITTV
jgi:NADPH2:quinone reductase